MTTFLEASPFYEAESYVPDEVRYLRALDKNCPEAIEYKQNSAAEFAVFVALHPQIAEGMGQE